MTPPGGGGTGEGRRGPDGGSGGGHARRIVGAAAVVAALYLLVALAFAGFKTGRHAWLFVYTEGNVLGSLAAYLEGGLSALYPAGWDAPPNVLTLYPPLYFWLAGALAPAAGGEASFLAPRLVSLAGLLAALAALAWACRIRRAPLAWALVLAGGVLLSQPLVNLLGGAQVDMAALGLGLWGALFVARGIEGTAPGPGEGAEEGAGSGEAEPRDAPPGPLPWIGLGFLVAALFTKQSLVAAPAAACLVLWRTGGRGRAIAFGGLFLGAAAAGLLGLDALTDGGYLRNTVGGLAGAWSPASLVELLRGSSPWVWLPAVALALTLAGRRLRPGFPEIWAVLAWTVALAAGLKLGASVNYLAEPILATIFLALWRYRGAFPEGGAGPLAGTGRRRTVAGVLLALVVLAAAPRAWRAATLSADLASGDWTIRIGGYEGAGHPLVDAEYVPAVLRQGGAPYLNDTFAFGILAQTGAWDPTPLLRDVERGDVPFILSRADMRRPSGASAGLGGYTHFWWIPAFRARVLEHYRLRSESPPFLWTPRAPDADGVEPTGETGPMDGAEASAPAGDP